MVCNVIHIVKRKQIVAVCYPLYVDYGNELRFKWRVVHASDLGLIVRQSRLGGVN